MVTPCFYTPPKSRSELRNISGLKHQLIEIAQQLKYIDRVSLYGVECWELDRIDGATFISVVEDSEFRDVWEVILKYMALIALVETREETDGGGPEDMMWTSRGDAAIPDSHLSKG